MNLLSYLVFGVHIFSVFPQKLQSELAVTHPDSNLLFKDFMKKYGYPYESYKITTDDGYILKIFRIRHGKNSNTTNKIPVILIHGMEGSSENFLVTGPNKGLAYNLADQGFDVWIPNLRGNFHSTKHTFLNFRDMKYWDYGWHEIAVYDVAKSIDFALAQTGQKKLYFIAHSQGCTCYFALMATLPEYNNKIKLAVHLGAPVLMYYVDYPLLNVLARIGPYIHRIMNFLSFDIIMNTYNPQMRAILKYICSESTIMAQGCRQIFYFFDPAGSNMDLHTLQVILASAPAGAAMKQGFHYLQIMESDEFKQYDYGDNNENLRVYGQEKPPPYDLTKCTAPVMFFTSYQDLTAPVKQFQVFDKVLNIHKKVFVEGYFHMDYIFSEDADVKVNKPLIEALYEIEAKYNKVNSTTLH